MDDPDLNRLFKLHQDQTDINEERFEQLVKSLVDVKTLTHKKAEVQTEIRKKDKLIKRLRKALKKSKIKLAQNKKNLRLKQKCNAMKVHQWKVE